MDSISSSTSANYGLQAQTYSRGGVSAPEDPSESPTPNSATKTSPETSKSNGEQLSSEEQAAIRSLQKRDRVVRQHEMAHLAAAGGLAVSGANFSMQTGPDGQRYAIGGEVRIDLSSGRTPEETVRKARIIQAAALAPADPSAQDRKVAAQAKAMEMQAAAEIALRSKNQQRVAGHYQSDSLPASTMSTQA